MPQLDQEIFVEYIICIFIVLLHFYTNGFVTKNLIITISRYKYIKWFFRKRFRLNKRTFILKNFYYNFLSKKRISNLNF